jgi:hypothetical protein
LQLSARLMPISLSNHFTHEAITNIGNFWDVLFYKEYVAKHDAYNIIQAK